MKKKKERENNKKNGRAGNEFQVVICFDSHYEKIKKNKIQYSKIIPIAIGWKFVECLRNVCWKWTDLTLAQTFSSLFISADIELHAGMKLINPFSISGSIFLCSSFEKVFYVYPTNERVYRLVLWMKKWRSWFVVKTVVGRKKLAEEKSEKLRMRQAKHRRLRRFKFVQLPLRARQNGASLWLSCSGAMPFTL